MKDFYQILGVNQQASDTEIKKAFRRLATVHHPDKSENENANAIFQEINEAYQVLGNPERRQLYDYLIRHQLEAWLFEEQPAPPRPYQSYTPPVRQNPAELYKPYLKFALWATRGALLVCLVILLDIVLPYRIRTETIQAIPLENELRLFGGYESASTSLLVTENETLPISRDDEAGFSDGNQIMIYKTPILNSFIKVVNLDNQMYKAGASYNIYTVFVFMPIILTITSLIGTFYQKDTEFTLKIGIANFTFSLLTIYFIVLIN